MAGLAYEDENSAPRKYPPILPAPKMDMDPPYYPPQYKRCYMEQTKLDLCTEFLGNESGAYFIDTDPSEVVPPESDGRRSSSRQAEPARRPLPESTSCAPPGPPLHVVACRRNGRLIMKATAAPQLRAERTQGRTKLSYTRAQNDVVSTDVGQHKAQDIISTTTRGPWGRCNTHGCGAYKNPFSHPSHSVASA